MYFLICAHMILVPNDTSVSTWFPFFTDVSRYSPTSSDFYRGLTFITDVNRLSPMVSVNHRRLPFFTHVFRWSPTSSDFHRRFLLFTDVFRYSLMFFPCSPLYCVFQMKACSTSARTVSDCRSSSTSPTRPSFTSTSSYSPGFLR